MKGVGLERSPVTLTLSHPKNVLDRETEIEESRFAELLDLLCPLPALRSFRSPSSLQGHTLTLKPRTPHLNPPLPVTPSSPPLLSAVLTK